MTTLTLEMMQRRWPQGNRKSPGLRGGIVGTAPAVFAEYGLNSPLVIAHAMAQFREECGQGLEMIESLNYTAAGLLKTFPTHFTPTMAQRWAHNQMMIGEIAYGGRIGNAPPPSTDGFLVRGAGVFPVTDRGGFAQIHALLDKHQTPVSIPDQPELIN